jgi:hypothetical protein
MAPPVRYLLPSSRELEPLSDEKVKAIVTFADNESRRGQQYAILGMICGTLSFFACLASYVYLVSLHHTEAAGVVLGTTVLAIIGRMIRGK